jgi:hypothetical protein
LDPAIDEMVGALGTVAGVASMAALAPPAPCEFTARTRTVYVVPFVRSEIVSGLTVVAGEAAVHVAPSLIEYS